MIISTQVLLIIKISLIVILLPTFKTTKPKQNHEPCSPFPYATLENGNITSIGTQKYMFKCNPGYYLASPPQVRCWKGKWSSLQKPTCSKIEGQCDDPPPIHGGKILGDLKYIGSIINYICDPGFILMGDRMRTCESSGHWSGITPTCMDESEPVQNVAERLKKDFVIEMGSHSSDISEDFLNGTNVTPCDTNGNSEKPCKSSSINVIIYTNNNSSVPNDETEAKDKDEFSPVVIYFPPTDPRFDRRQKRKHKKNREKLAFTPGLDTIAENIEGEKTAEEESSGEKMSIYEQENSHFNISCRKERRRKNPLKESVVSEDQKINNSSTLAVSDEEIRRPPKRKRLRDRTNHRQNASKMMPSGRMRNRKRVGKCKRGRKVNRNNMKEQNIEKQDDTTHIPLNEALKTTTV
ncbi:sushi, von Willebrand factor type A, EGF and pentraxin domain-containing protein 1 [Trichonephila clavata]|uniref:Sushi, von Willebrand factor type A, EGF and pentraxin domain-containing protein 1 n=1 Tax=Trichonephila clavata TaxID=2740835 RepID=A0A8X6LEW9_TRICU|nr:sushi, von Willebrand factor type A, EGF and pentraxin domain-containing protein 1 [Trichonephila clavata]